MAILANDPEADGVLIEEARDGRDARTPDRRATLREPIVQYGPFVMNSEQEIYRALGDYREGRLA